MSSDADALLVCVARGEMSAEEAAARRGAPVVRVTDVVEAALTSSRVLTVSNALGDVQAARARPTPHVRVTRAAAAESQEAARALLMSVTVTSDRTGVRVLRTREGAVSARVEAAVGPFDAFTVEGDRVWAHDLSGEVVIRASAGLDLWACGGSVDAAVEHGDVTVRDVSGRMVVRLGRGVVHVTGASGHLEATCVEGDVRIERFAGDIIARAPQGEVHVLARRDAPAAPGS